MTGLNEGVSLPFVAAVVAGVTAQVVKVLSFLLLEKRLNYRRFVQADGTPNMHSAAFAALTLEVGLRDGFGSVVFALALCLTAMVSVDIWNVKRAASKHAELIELILDRVGRSGRNPEAARKALSYTPVDVLAGTVLGCVVALLVV